MKFEDASQIISAMTTHQRGIIGKKCRDQLKYKPVTERDIALVDFIIKEFQLTLSLPERMFLLANKRKEPDYCIVCGKISAFCTDKYEYGKFCSKTCRYEQRKLTPNCARFFKINDVVYSRISDAATALGISRHVLLSRCVSNLHSSYQYHPDHQAGLDDMMKKLIKKSSLLGDKEFLEFAREEKVSINKMYVQLEVTRDDIYNAMSLFDIPTDFDIISKETRLILDDKEKMQELIIKWGSAEKMSEKLECSPSTILNYLEIYQIDYKVISKGEIEIAEFVNVSYPDVKIVKQDRKQLKPKEIDVYLPELRVGIEHNGVYWHRDDPFSHKIKYDLARKSNNRLVQIFEDDWNLKRKLMQTKIMNAINSKMKTIKIKDTTIHEDILQDQMFMISLKSKEEILMSVTFKNNEIIAYVLHMNVKDGLKHIIEYARLTKRLDAIETTIDLMYEHGNEFGKGISLNASIGSQNVVRISS